MAYPLHDFKCLYEHACPYLNFMSTRWVFSQYQYGQDEYQEHLKIIDRFQESLKERDEKKKRGAPMGHPGWQRPKPVNIDQTIAVDAPTVCPYCHKQGLTPSPSLHEHIQEDIVLEPRTVVTRYLHGQAFCSTCNRLVVQPGQGEILNAPIGPVAKSVAIYLPNEIGTKLLPFTLALLLVGVEYRPEGDRFCNVVGNGLKPFPTGE